ncbi:MAG TPA: type VI secretion system protein IglI family protein [Kofleriaceae bacterium]|nr:type VI secretion system protein IglI family protein [Kofleriaceae bacterium]
MKAVAELPARLLDGRLTPATEPDDGASATRIAYATQLADRGDHAGAAREAATLIEGGIHDIRLIGFYVFGLFVQRGVGQLPALLARMTGLINDDLAMLKPERRKLQVVNSAAAWLFEHVSAQLLFHVKQRDATWDAWCSERDSGLPDAIAAGCGKLTAALEAVIDAPLAAVPLARIRRWALEDLRRALARREAAASAAPAASAPVPAEVAPEAPEAAPEDLPADESEPHATPITALPRADLPVAVGSPALAVLQAKLAGFQALVDRGELARAAIVAADLRATLASFDPITFFPSLFAAYFKALHEVVDDLTPYLDASDQPSWHALESYYRADLRGFLED